MFMMCPLSSLFTNPTLTMSRDQKIQPCIKQYMLTQQPILISHDLPAWSSDYVMGTRFVI